MVFLSWPGQSFLPFFLYECFSLTFLSISFHNFLILACVLFLDSATNVFVCFKEHLSTLNSSIWLFLLQGPTTATGFLPSLSRGFAALAASLWLSQPLDDFPFGSWVPHRYVRVFTFLQLFPLVSLGCSLSSGPVLPVYSDNRRTGLRDDSSP